jgi:hypothetical protein
MPDIPKKSYIKKAFKIFFLLLFIVFLVVLVTYALRSPSNEREWPLDQQVLSYAIFDDNTVEVKNIRNFTYTSPKEYTPHYYDRIFDLDAIQTVSYIVEPLASVAAAHTFLSFGFENGNYVAISIESRREADELFSPFKGVVREYELMYVVADERDVVNLRANHRKRDVYLYPIQASPDIIRELFIDMLTRANNLKDNPEFYNTITNSCATNIADHVNIIAPQTIPWDYRLILPKNSDEFAYELGLIDNSITLEEARKKYLISPAAAKYIDDPDFSKKIREGF